MVVLWMGLVLGVFVEFLVVWVEVVGSGGGGGGFIVVVEGFSGRRF